MYLYKNSGKKLKKAIRIINPLSYFVGDLIGIAGGIFVAWFLRSTAIGSFWACVISILAAGAIAAIPIIYFWIRGLIWWNISEAVDKDNADCENQDV